MFMRSLKQRFSRWYNGRKQRKGTLWEERYRSVAVEIGEAGGYGHAARVVAAYIDLNPVRAGMVEDPKDYGWSGYGRAVRGEKECVRGVLKLWGGQGGAPAAMAAYRVFLFEEGSEERCPGGEVGDRKSGARKRREGIEARKVWEERGRGGRLPMAVLLRLRSRYLVDGVAIGSAGFLRRLTGRKEGMGSGEGEGSGQRGGKEVGREGVAMRYGQWGGLRVLRDLRVRVVG